MCMHRITHSGSARTERHGTLLGFEPSERYMTQRDHEQKGEWSTLSLFECFDLTRKISEHAAGKEALNTKEKHISYGSP